MRKCPPVPAVARGEHGLSTAWWEERAAGTRPKGPGPWVGARTAQAASGRPLLRHTRATSIQCSTTRALSSAFILRSPRHVVMTQLATLLNWATVARMVGARCSLPFLSRCDQMEPRQWYGTTFLNSSCGPGHSSAATLAPAWGPALGVAAQKAQEGAAGPFQGWQWGPCPADRDQGLWLSPNAYTCPSQVGLAPSRHTSADSAPAHVYKLGAYCVLGRPHSRCVWGGPPFCPQGTQH